MGGRDSWLLPVVRNIDFGPFVSGQVIRVNGGAQTWPALFDPCSRW